MTKSYYKYLMHLLACVPLHQVCILAANNWFNKGREVTITALKYAELQIKLKENID